jgi:two-component system sensor histidine kinase KdpD
VIRDRVLLAVIGLALVPTVLLAPSAGHAQEPPPSSPPELGLPPATARPAESEAPPATTVATAVSSRDRNGGDDESFGAAVVGTFTKPGRLVGGLILALGLGLIVGATPRLRRRRGRRTPPERLGLASAHTARARVEPEPSKADLIAREEANRQKSELIALVSEELSAPLTAMERFVGTVRLNWDELPAERRREFIDRASVNAVQLRRVFDQLLDFFRVDTHLVTMRPRPIVISDAVERTLGELRSVLANHRVYVDIPDGLAIRADVAAFGDVLTNLLTNAAKYSPAGRRIIVSATRADGAVDLSVSDEGSGIPPEEHERIFDPFYQSPYNNELRRGTGVGLAIAKRLTELHGGRVAVVSEPGLGSTFWVTMPAAAGRTRRIDRAEDEVTS